MLQSPFFACDPPNPFIFQGDDGHNAQMGCNSSNPHRPLCKTLQCSVDAFGCTRLSMRCGRALASVAAAALRARDGARLLAGVATPAGAADALRGRACEAASLERSRACRQRFSSQAAPAAAPPPPLKSLLRQLYLRVHPDLFTHSPAEQARPVSPNTSCSWFRVADACGEQATNQRSFILLQEYLSQAESGAEAHGRAVSQAFAFEFFVRTDDAGEGDDTVASVPAAPARLRRVALTLPPPGRRQPGQDSGRRAAACRDALRLALRRAAHAPPRSLPPATALALGRLLHACGLDSAFSGVAGASAPAEGLLEMLPAAAEALRQSESAARTPEDVIRMARAALRMGRGVMLSFAPSAPTGARCPWRNAFSRRVADAHPHCRRCVGARAAGAAAGGGAGRIAAGAPARCFHRAR